MKYNLPEDLKSYKPNPMGKILNIIIRLAIVGVVCFFIMRLARNVIESNPVLKIILFVIFGIVAIACVVSVFLQKVSDITCAGTVENVKVKTKTESDTPEKPTRESLYTFHVVELLIRDPEGSARWIKAAKYKSKDVDHNYIDRFRAGAEVFHLCGTNTTVFLPTDSDTVVTCAVCGAVNQKEYETCHSCGHTLIKSLKQIT